MEIRWPMNAKYVIMPVRCALKIQHCIALAVKHTILQIISYLMVLLNA